MRKALDCREAPILELRDIQDDDLNAFAAGAAATASISRHDPRSIGQTSQLANNVENCSAHVTWSLKVQGQQQC
jgi:hypothetical protein